MSKHQHSHTYTYKGNKYDVYIVNPSTLWNTVVRPETMTANYNN